MSEINNAIIKSIEILIQKALKNQSYDRTFLSVVSEVHGNGTYTIMNEGQNHKVKCSLPDVELKVGQGVWVKIPNGDFNSKHICGVR